MKILISGATGFIGKHLTKELLQTDTEIWAIVRPTTTKKSLDKKIRTFIFDNNTETLCSFMEKEQFDGVIHLASVFLAQHKTSDIRDLIDSNLFFSTALLEAASKSGTSWFINTGTFWQHYNNKKYSPVNLYAATKEAFETIARYYIETTPINFVTIKLSDTFGPQDTRLKILNLWLKISKTGETLDMSPGKQLIDISYIDNVTSGYLQMIQNISKDTKQALKGKSFVISSPKIISLQKLATIFEKIIGKKLNINWGKKEYRKREVMIPWNKGKVVPGWKARVNLEEGIKRTIDEQSHHV